MFPIAFGLLHPKSTSAQILDSSSYWRHIRGSRVSKIYFPVSNPQSSNMLHRDLDPSDSPDKTYTMHTATTSKKHARSPSADSSDEPANKRQRPAPCNPPGCSDAIKLPTVQGSHRNFSAVPASSKFAGPSLVLLSTPELPKLPTPRFNLLEDRVIAAQRHLDSLLGGPAIRVFVPSGSAITPFPWKNTYLRHIYYLNSVIFCTKRLDYLGAFATKRLPLKGPSFVKPLSEMPACFVQCYRDPYRMISLLDYLPPIDAYISVLAGKQPVRTLRISTGVRRGNGHNLPTLTRIGNTWRYLLQNMTKSLTIFLRRCAALPNAWDVLQRELAPAACTSEPRPLKSSPVPSSDYLEHPGYRSFLRFAWNCWTSASSGYLPRAEHTNDVLHITNLVHNWLAMDERDISVVLADKAIFCRTTDDHSDRVGFQDYIVWLLIVSDIFALFAEINFSK